MIEDSGIGLKAAKVWSYALLLRHDLYERKLWSYALAMPCPAGQDPKGGCLVLRVV